MTAIEEMTSSFLGPEEIGIEFIELCGKKVFDLLAPGEEKTAVKLREAADGSLALEGATQMVCLASHELTMVMEKAHKRRNTESTGANQVSSRSHAVCILSVKSSRGKLLLVDLAGSERRKDSMWHDKERQREGAEINASIHALKECIRMQKSKNAIIPFRLSTLTRILAETFTNPQARLAVIATVSPCATDVEHTVSTLKTVHQLALDPVPIAETKQTEMYPRDAEKKNSQHPKKWTAHQVAQWLEKEGETSLAGIPKSTTGAMLVRMPESRFVQACGGDERRGAKLYRSLHVLMQDLRDSKNST
jgi:kinesin family protein 2/24